MLSFFRDNLLFLASSVGVGEGVLGVRTTHSVGERAMHSLSVSVTVLVSGNSLSFTNCSIYASLSNAVETLTSDM